MDKLKPDRSIYLRGIISFFLAFFLILAPYNNALYFSANYLFEMPVFVWLLVLIAPCLVGGMLFYIKREERTMPELIAFVAVLLIPASALVSHWLAEASYVSYLSFLVRLAAALLFMTASVLARDKAFSHLLLNVTMGAGYMLVLHGFLCIAGIVHYKDAILLSGPIDQLDLRLNSVFQYANAYAAYLNALLLGSLYGIVHIRSKKLYAFVAFMLVPITLSLLLTGSKGGLVVLIGGLAALLLCLSLYRQLQVLLVLAVCFAVSIPLASPVMRLGVDIGSPSGGRASASTVLLLVIIPSLIVATLLLLVHGRRSDRLQASIRLLESFRFARYVLVGAPVAAGTLATALFILALLYVPQAIPEYIKERLGNLTSFSERFLFYMDSLRMFANHPAAGIGGGGWGDVIMHYKSAPYQSTQAHSFVAQTLSEYGILGLLCMLLFIIYVYIAFIRHHRAQGEAQDFQPVIVFFLFSFSLLLHSMIDFTMTFTYLLLLVFISLGAMYAPAAASGRRPGKWSAASLVLIVPLSLFVGGQAAGIVSTNDTFRKAMNTDESLKNPSAALSVLQPALSRINSNPYIIMYGNSLLIQLFMQSRDDAYLQQAEIALQTLRSKEGYSSAVREQQYQFYLSKGDMEGAFSFAEKQLDVYPWDIQLYENLVQTAYRIGMARIDAGIYTEAQIWWDRALDYYARADAKNTMLKRTGRATEAIRFDSTDLMAYNVAIIQFSRGQYGAAEMTLKNKITYYPENDTQKGIVRWYLASLLKQNKEDLALYNQLISIDIREKNLVAELVKP